VRAKLRSITDFLQKFGNDWAFSLSTLLAYNFLTATFPLFLGILALGALVLPTAQIRDLASVLTYSLPGGVTSATGLNVNLYSMLVDFHQASKLTAIISFGGFIWTGSNLFSAMENCFSIIFRTRGRDPLDLCRFLGRAVGLDPALDRDELDLRRGRHQSIPERVGHEPGLDTDTLRPDRGDQLGPAGRQVVVCLEEARLGRFAPDLDRIARIGEDDDFVRGDEEPPGVARDLLFAVTEREPGQIAHVFAPDAEVGADPGVGEPSRETGQACRSGGPVRFEPAGQVRRRGCCGEVGREWKPTRCRLGHGLRYLLMFA